MLVYSTDPHPYTEELRNGVWPENKGMLARIMDNIRASVYYRTLAIWEQNADEL